MTIYYETDIKVLNKYLEESTSILNLLNQKEIDENKEFIDPLSKAMIFLTGWNYHSGNHKMINNLNKKLKAFENLIGAKPICGKIVGSEQSKSKIWLLWARPKIDKSE